MGFNTEITGSTEITCSTKSLRFPLVSNECSLMCNYSRAKCSLAIDQMCNLCEEHTETVLHSLRVCKVVGEVWRQVEGPTNASNCCTGNFKQWLVCHCAFADLEMEELCDFIELKKC